MTTIPFNEQVEIFRCEVFKAFDYVAMDDFYRAKLAIYDGDYDAVILLVDLERAIELAGLTERQREALS